MNAQMTATWIIAEVGVNHNGDLKQAKALVDVAKQAGCDSVKFQLFDPILLVTAHATLAEYQQKNTQTVQSQQQMLAQLMLSKEEFISLHHYCLAQQIEFLATPFDVENLFFLTDTLKCATIKIGSGDITDGPLLLAAARKNCNVILSTGMTTLGEIEQALSLLAFGYTNLQDDPTQDAMMRAYYSPAGLACLQEHVTLLHCCSQYPAQAEQVNLLAMQTLQHTFQLPVGYSDHSTGIVIPIAAASLGACIIEKHITLDKTQPGPDHLASLEPTELREMVAGIREVEAALGHGRKIPVPAELQMRHHARKSLVAKQALQPGQIIQAQDLACKRPGNGISPMSYWQWLNKPSPHRYAADDLIREE